MDLDSITYEELLAACNGDLQLLFDLLVDLLGSRDAAEQSIITEDLVVE